MITVCKDCLIETNGVNATNKPNDFDFLDVCPECNSIENTIQLTDEQYEFITELNESQSQIFIPLKSPLK